MKYLVHFAETTFYDVPVEADDNEAAFQKASEIVNDEHIDRKSRTMELAEWTTTPIERLPMGAREDSP